MSFPNRPMGLPLSISPRQKLLSSVHDDNQRYRIDRLPSRSYRSETSTRDRETVMDSENFMKLMAVAEEMKKIHLPAALSHYRTIMTGNDEQKMPEESFLGSSIEDIIPVTAANSECSGEEQYDQDQANDYFNDESKRFQRRKELISVTKDRTAALAEKDEEEASARLRTDMGQHLTKNSPTIGDINERSKSDHDYLQEQLNVLLIDNARLLNEKERLEEENTWLTSRYKDIDQIQDKYQQVEREMKTYKADLLVKEEELKQTRKEKANALMERNDALTRLGKEMRQKLTDSNPISPIAEFSGRSKDYQGEIKELRKQVNALLNDKERLEEENKKLQIKTFKAELKFKKDEVRQARKGNRNALVEKDISLTRSKSLRSSRGQKPEDLYHDGDIAMDTIDLSDLRNLMHLARECQKIDLADALVFYKELMEKTKMELNSEQDTSHGCHGIWY